MAYTIKDRIPGKFIPAKGETYDNEGGGRYLCLDAYGANAWFRNINSGWTFVAHNCHLYPDGSIDWDYSSHGRFENASFA